MPNYAAPFKTEGAAFLLLKRWLRIDGGMATQSTEHEQNDEDNHQQAQDPSEAASPVIPLAMAIEAAAAKQQDEHYDNQNERHSCDPP
jgi:hypothetical protein